MGRYRLPGEETEIEERKERNQREKSLAWARIIKEKLAK